MNSLERQGRKNFHTEVTEARLGEHGHICENHSVNSVALSFRDINARRPP